MKILYMNTKTFQIFRAGKHTAMQGVAVEFSEYDLMRAAAAYNPRLHVAPLVLGHPATDDPAYGTVERLTMQGGNLFAEAKVSPELTQLVQDGKYLRVSAAFYSPDASNNPTPKSWYLRHVGFLGAQPPAVKGMAPPVFAASAAGCIAFMDGVPLPAPVKAAAGVSFAEDPQGFDAAVKALMGKQPGMTYAQAATEIDRLYRESQSLSQHTVDATRGAEHAAITRATHENAGMTYGEAAGRYFASR